MFKDGAMEEEGELDGYNPCAGSDDDNGVKRGFQSSFYDDECQRDEDEEETHFKRQRTHKEEVESGEEDGEIEDDGGQGQQVASKASENVAKDADDEEEEGELDEEADAPLATIEDDLAFLDRQGTAANGGLRAPAPESGMNDECDGRIPDTASGLYMNGIDPTTLKRRTYAICVVVENYPGAVTNTALMHLFKDCGEIVTIQCVRDRNSGAYKGYSFVYFDKEDGHDKAMASRKMLNGYRVLTTSSREKKTLFVSNIHSDVTVDTVKEEVLALLPEDMQSKVEMVELKTGPPPARLSRGFAFVEMRDFESAEKARNILYFCRLRDRPLSCVWADKNKADLQTKSATVFINNLSKDAGESDVKDLFAPFGDIVKVVVVKNMQTGESRGYAFVEYTERSAAADAVEKMNASDYMGQELYVDFAKPRAHNTTRGGGPPGSQLGVLGMPIGTGMMGGNHMVPHRGPMMPAGMGGVPTMGMTGGMGIGPGPAAGIMGMHPGAMRAPATGTGILSTPYTVTGDGAALAKQQTWTLKGRYPQYGSGMGPGHSPNSSSSYSRHSSRHSGHPRY